jgi:hypothetical protein
MRALNADLITGLRLGEVMSTNGPFIGMSDKKMYWKLVRVPDGDAKSYLFDLFYFDVYMGSVYVAPQADGSVKIRETQRGNK